MKISVLVVTYNDEKHLKDCLIPLKSFDELVVVDLGSTDRSLEIAKDLGINVIARSWVPIIEMVLPTLIPTLKNDWVLRIDPDEVLPSALVDDLLALEPDKNVGAIVLPLQYYFLNKKLNNTVWGGMRYSRGVIHKKRVIIGPQVVHVSYDLRDGYKLFTIKFKGDNFVAHYWVDSYSQLYSKHERYLKMEGKARFTRGQRFSWKRLIRYTLEEFIASFVHKSGWRGGWTGWFLSFFYAQYEARSWLALRRYENSQKQGLR